MENAPSVPKESADVHGNDFANDNDPMRSGALHGDAPVIVVRRSHTKGMPAGLQIEFGIGGVLEGIHGKRWISALKVSNQSDPALLFRFH